MTLQNPRAQPASVYKKNPPLATSLLLHVELQWRSIMLALDSASPVPRGTADVRMSWVLLFKDWMYQDCPSFVTHKSTNHNWAVPNGMQPLIRISSGRYPFRYLHRMYTVHSIRRRWMSAISLTRMQRLFCVESDGDRAVRSAPNFVRTKSWLKGILCKSSLRNCFSQQRPCKNVPACFILVPSDGITLAHLRVTAWLNPAKYLAKP